MLLCDIHMGLGAACGTPERHESSAWERIGHCRSRHSPGYLLPFLIPVLLGPQCRYPAGSGAKGISAALGEEGPL